jgi:cysteine synthase A
MGIVYQKITETIGKTPLMRLNRYEKFACVNAVILGKLEYFNPAGSIKDRAALYMLEDAKKRGLLKPGSVIIEPTSGNTGIGIAMIAASRGYKAIFTMPDTMSIERRALLAAYGAELVLTDGKLGMNGAVEKAKELTNEMDNSYMPSQFTNPANPASHFNGTRRGC